MKIYGVYNEDDDNNDWYVNEDDGGRGYRTSRSGVDLTNAKETPHMAVYDGSCLGSGTPDAFCICHCHTFPDEGCDTTFCAPVAAKASDNTRLRHINRDPDRGKRSTRRGSRSLRRS